MQEHDARILRGAAIPTAIVGALAMAAAYFLRDANGLIGALVGAVLVLAFFGASALFLAWIGKKWPELLLMAALAAYTIKVVLLGIALLLFGGTTAFDGPSFALSAAACVIAWLTGHSVASIRVRRVYVEPVGSEDPVEERQ